MTERFNLKINVAKMYEKCSGCPFGHLETYKRTEDGYTVGGHTGRVICRVAALEKKIKHTPTFGEIENSLHVLGHYWWRIPEKCPNKYRNYSDLKASSRRE